MTISTNGTGVRPGICLSTSRPSSPYEGMVIYETDTDLLRVYDGSSWKAVITPTLTASTGYLRYQESWTQMTLVSGWQGYDVNTWGTGQFYRTNDGIVHLRGLLRRTSGSSNTICNLPVGYRPPHSHMFVVAGSGGVGRIDVSTNGDVTWQGNQAGSVNIADWVSVFEIHFGVF